MKTVDLQELAMFTGTQQYHYLNPKTLLTDGAMYLAVNAECFWLMDAISSHLLTMKNASSYAHVNLAVSNSEGDLVITDGNGVVLGKQHFGYTDFPLEHIDLYCVYENDVWIVMLTSEY